MSKTKQMVMVALIVMTNMAVGLILYRNFAPRKRPAIITGLIPEQAAVSENLSILESVPDYDKSMSVFTHPDFLKLKKFGTWPVAAPAESGRPNPFLPVTNP